VNNTPETRKVKKNAPETLVVVKNAPDASKDVKNAPDVARWAERQGSALCVLKQSQSVQHTITALPLAVH
jgi:hypothetical protein